MQPDPTLSLTPDDLSRLQPLPRHEQAIRLLTGAIGPLGRTASSFGCSDALGTEVARLAYLLYLSRTWAFAAGILKGKKPTDALETWRARVRASMDQPSPRALALLLFERLGVEWDAVSIDDRRFVHTWTDEMRTCEPSDGDRSRAIWWPSLQEQTAISEAMLGADLLRDWLRELAGKAPADAAIDPETLDLMTPAQRLALGLH